MEQIRATAQAVIEEHSKQNDKITEERNHSKADNSETEKEENHSGSGTNDKLKVDTHNKNKPIGNNPLDQIPIKVTLEPPGMVLLVNCVL